MKSMSGNLRRTLILTFLLIGLALGFSPPVRVAETAPAPAREDGRPRAAALSTPDASTRARVGEAYGKLPLSFEANEGQADARVKFVSRGDGYKLSLAPDEAILALRKERRGNNEKVDHNVKASPSSSSRANSSFVVRMKLLGAARGARAVAQEELPGRINYLSGGDARKWRRGVAAYGKVRFENVYEGVDLVYYGNQRQLEYDFHVAPGADPNTIRLSFEGADKILVDENGELVLRARGGEEVRQRRPFIYQEVGGARREIEGGYAMLGGGRVGFRLGEYDRRRPLVIDPVLVYTNFFSGTGSDESYGIAVDSSGAAYVTGIADSRDFPTTPGALRRSITGEGGDAFVTKISPDGRSLVYSTYLGGGQNDIGEDIAVDSSGNAYVIGWTASTDFPVRNGAQTTHRGGVDDAFVVKLNAAGSDILYSTYLGGSNLEAVNQSIAVDNSGHAYVSGNTWSQNFPTTPGALRTTADIRPPVGDYFLAKINTNAAGASSLVFSTYMDAGGGVAADSAGNTYTARGTQVLKINPTGTAVVYRFNLPTSLNQYGSPSVYAGGIAVDSSGNAYVAGVANAAPGLTAPANGFQQQVRGKNDVFLLKLDPTGTRILYLTYLGGSEHDAGGIVTADNAGFAYLTGRTESADFPLRDPVRSTPGSGIFVTKVNTNTTGADSLVYSTHFSGGNAKEMSRGIATDGAGNAYVTGFPIHINAIGIIHTGATSIQPGLGVGGGASQNNAPTTPQTPAFVFKIESPNPPVSASASALQFSADSYSVAEDGGSVGVTVTRSGDSSRPLWVDYATSDGTASERADYTSALGTLYFAPGETTKTFRVLVTDDAFSEPGETVNLTLLNPSNAQLGGPASAALTITDDDEGASATANAIDDAETFVRQHYHDFLNREPDASGLSFWTNQITECGADAVCRDMRKANVSAAFFLSIEFQGTGYFVHRLERASFGRMPRLADFLRSTQEIGQDVVVNQTGWAEQMDANRRAFVEQWAARADFRAIYDALSNAQYVDALYANAGVSPSASERDALINGLNQGGETRATVLRKVAEHPELRRAEFNKAFVLMQYFGYLRRNPNDAPEPNLNYEGFNFWLKKLDEHGGNYIEAEMVNSFLVSGEYRSRFGRP